MSLVQAKCTNCGGKLKVDSTKETQVCEYCNAVLNVQDAVENYNTAIENAKIKAQNAEIAEKNANTKNIKNTKNNKTAAEIISGEEKEKQNKILEIKAKRKKTVLIFIGSFMGLFLLVGLITLILSGIVSVMKEQDTGTTPRSYIYPTPDYNYNIFDDDGYMSSDRQIWFNDNGAKTVITAENYKTYPVEAMFMYDVVNFIINGDYTEYNKIFTDDYVKNAGDDLREQFTMQQLFEIEIEYVDYREENKAVYWDMQLNYRIRNNNGTFRNDLDFNDAGSLPVVYRLVYEDDGTAGADATINVSDIKVTDILSRYRYDRRLYD